jgi:hypothetical protein
MTNKLLKILSKEQLIEEFKALGSATKIAKKYKINPITVYSAFEIINFNCKINTDAESILTKEMLEKDYKELQSFRKIGDKYNISNETIRYYCQKFGIQTNPLVKYSCNDDFFAQENEEVFYIAGFLAADGCLKIKKNKISNKEYYFVYIGLSKKDKSFLELIKSKLQAEAPIKDFLIKNSKRNPKWKDSWKSEITITSEKMFKDLEKFNIVPRKSLIYTLPDWLIEHPLVSHFMRGYNDGDGCFFNQKHKTKADQVMFSLRGTPKFLTTFREILEEKCDLKERTKPIRISSGHGALEYGGNGILKNICQFLYRDATIYLPRKYDIIKHLLSQ